MLDGTMCRILYALDYPYMYIHLRKFLEQRDHKRKHTPGINNNPTQAPDYLRNTTSPSDSVNHLNPRDMDQHTDGFGLAWFHPVWRNWTTMRSTSVYSSVDNNHTQAPDYLRFITSSLVDSRRYSVDHLNIQDVINNVGIRNVIVGHLRHADRESSVAIENTHPFRYANHIFAHNGTITGYCDNREVILSRILSEFKQRIKGDTDTEMLFYLFLTECEKQTGTDAERLVLGLKQTLAFLKLHFPEITANIVYANTNYSLITRYRYSRDNTPGQAPSLYWNGEYTHRTEKVLISSEPILDESYIIGENQYILVRHNGYGPIQCGRL